MKSRGLLLAIIAGLLGIAYLATLGLYADARPSFLRPAYARMQRGGARFNDTSKPVFEDLLVVVNVPHEDPAQIQEKAPAADSPGFSPSQVRAAMRYGFSSGECPKDMASSMLGAIISQDRCTVVSVEPEGPADVAGLQPADRIRFCDGERVKCPATLLDILQARSESGDAQLIIRRPLVDQAETPAE